MNVYRIKTDYKLRTSARAGKGLWLTTVNEGQCDSRGGGGDEGVV